MRTGQLHSRQLCSQSTNGTLPCDHKWRPLQEGNYNKKSEVNFKKTQYNTKIVTHFEHKCPPSNAPCAPAPCIHVSFACNQQLAHCRATVRGSAIQSGAFGTREQNVNGKNTKHHTSKNQLHILNN
jgi:hypothetical protein